MKAFVVSLLIAFMCTTADSEAANVAGIDLPEMHGEFRLHGAGLLRKGFLFKIYTGALYVTDTNHVATINGDVPKRIDIHYFHNTPKKYMIRTAQDTLQKNLSPEAYRKLLPEIDQLHTAFRDGQKKSCASIIYRKGEGLTYLFDGVEIITIPNDEFARAYFTIWLGERPSSRSVKEAMLSGALYQ